MSTPSLQKLFHPDAISADTRRINVELAATLATIEPPRELAALRQAYVDGRLGLPASPKSARADVCHPQPGR